MIKVEGHPHLYRDDITGAIVNMNGVDYGNRLKQISSSQSEKISQLISEIDKKYAGLAKTLGGLASSEAKQLSMAMGDMQERFGQALAETLNPLIRAFTALGESINVEIFRILIRTGMTLAGTFVILKSGKALMGVVTAF